MCDNLCWIKHTQSLGWWWGGGHFCDKQVREELALHSEETPNHSQIFAVSSGKIVLIVPAVAFFVVKFSPLNESGYLISAAGASTLLL